MNFQSLFLSYEGRIRRSHFWIGLIILLVVEWVIMAVTIGSAMSTAAMTHNPGAMFGGAALIGWILLLLYPALAVYTKRWHDRGKSGWMSLVGLIPIVGPFWLLIELGFLDGTQGPNQYGPSPKGIEGSAPAAA